MTSILIRLNRFFGSFWLRRRTGLYARFVGSWAYGPTVALVGLGGVCLVVGGTLQWPGTVGPLLWFVVSLLSVLLLLTFLTSFGASAVHSSEHTAAPDELLARCQELLEQHGFRVERRKSGGLRARRGAKARAESEWRSFPIEVIVTAKPAGSLCTLTVQCTDAVATYRFIRELVEKTSKAVAELNALALAALDRTLVHRQHALMMGGLAKTIFATLTGSVLLAALTLASLTAVVGSHVVDLQRRQKLLNLSTTHLVYVLGEMDRPQRLELERFLATQRGKELGPSRKEFFKWLKSGVGQSMLLALQGSDGQVLLWHPDSESPLRPIAEALVTTGLKGRGFQKVGNRFFKPLDPLDLGSHERLASVLWVPEDMLIAGWFLTLDDLARRAPRILSLEGDTELTFFSQGTSIARYRWTDPHLTDPDVKVDEGSAQIPEEVMQATMKEMHRSVLDVLVRPSWADRFREETRDGKRYWVLYGGEPSPTGWRGTSFAVRGGEGIDVTDVSRSYDAAALVGVIGLLGVLVLVSFPAIALSGRIARPVLQVRDALRSIAEGNYSVRIESKRTDEIGQLQKLVNHTAEELRKRESIKDLMGKYLSKQVADRILESDAEGMLVDSRKEVSVLFADVRGFTTYSERHDPEQVTKSLNEYFEVMVDLIASHEGVLDKYIGDGLMVVFGAPMAQPDHASRAVITALEMQAALQTLNLKRAQRGEEPISIGIGVNTGLAISGNLGSIKRMEFTVIGDTVNLAARLENRAGQGQVLIGSKTYAKVKDLIVSEALGPVTVKGKAEPVDVWLVKGLNPAKPVGNGPGDVS